MRISMATTSKLILLLLYIIVGVVKADAYDYMFENPTSKSYTYVVFQTKGVFDCVCTMMMGLEVCSKKVIVK